MGAPFPLLETFLFNPLWTELTLSHYILEDSNFSFRYVRLSDLDIPGEKWLNYLQTVATLIRRCILRRLIWVCTVCQLPFQGSPDYTGLKKPNGRGNYFDIYFDILFKV